MGKDGRYLHPWKGPFTLTTFLSDGDSTNVLGCFSCSLSFALSFRRSDLRSEVNPRLCFGRYARPICL